MPASVDVAAANQLTKQSCHDSGIDIRCPTVGPATPALPTVAPIVKKKNYSDADIVLSSDWVPPLTIAPTIYTETAPATVQSAQSQAQALNAETGGRKKTSSVSFSVDDDGGGGGGAGTDKATAAAGDNKKNKMLKRLSYPLSWVEGLTSDGKPATATGGNSSTDNESAPNTGDSGQSVFSKVFSR